MVKQYYITKNGKIIDENNQIIPMNENSIQYQNYIDWLRNENELIETDYLPEEDFLQSLVELETEKYIKRTNDGINAYAKLSAEFRLAKLSGLISEEVHSGIEKILIPVRNEVLAGQWISSLKQLEEIGSNLIGESLYNRLHSQITNYINENY